MPQLPRGSVMQRLHDRDGTEQGAAPALGRFRLVFEAPRGAPALGEVFDPSSARAGAPYKLFEIVPGAVIELSCEPERRAEVRAEVRVDGRSFPWRSSARTDDTGVARLRVPYPAGDRSVEARAAGRAPAPLQVTCGGLVGRVRVPASAVQAGQRVRATLAAPEARPAR
jgi:hypothetical protein